MNTELLLVRDLTDAVGDPEQPKPQWAWAQRRMRGHADAVENLAALAWQILAR